MKKKLFLIVMSVVLCLPTFADSMCVNLKNGETISFDFEDIENVTICKSIPVVDESETPLKFKITSDSTAEVMTDHLIKTMILIPSPSLQKCELTAWFMMTLLSV